ncbi:hypothetical protein C8J57DRAFT_1727728 [Mycena rebaudengoi]|nr:hypothetical protein C8J57DRAFT_1727728 [Mycena rebaudengoi]
MPPRQVNLAEENKRLLAQLKAQEKQIVAYRTKEKARTARKTLIPKPKGQAGRGVQAGGYNLQDEIGLKNDDEHYQRLKRMVKRYVHKWLDVFEPIARQDKIKLRQMIAAVQKDIEFFQKFENGWPVKDFARTYLSNEQTRRAVDIKAERKWSNHSDEEDEDDDLPRAERLATKKVKFVSDDDGEEELEDGDTQPEGKKPKEKATEKKPKQKVTNRKIILSDDEDDSDAADLAKLIKQKPTHTPTAQKRKSPPVTEIVKPPKKKVKTSENTNPKATTTKPKIPTPKATPTVKELEWADLPRSCPAALCDDSLPTESVPALLSLFNRLTALKAEKGQNAPGSHFIQLEICALITREKRRDYNRDLGKQRRWPTHIDYMDLQSRIIDQQEYILEVLQNPQELAKCPLWTELMLAIDYKLDRFAGSKDKSGYANAIQSKRCGYFGPQGEFVIYSCLMKLLAEAELGHDEDLDNLLCSTIQSVVSEDARYKYDVTSNFLTVDDFTRFILVPLTAILLITHDLSFDDFQSALFERNASNEFGDLFHPEDDNDEIVHEIHRQNVMWIRTAIRQREGENIKEDKIPEEIKAAEAKATEAAPPRFRKPNNDKLKICLPAPGPIPPTQFKTLEDFPSPQKKPRKSKPVAKKKTTQKARPTPTSTTSNYGTRSRTSRSKPSAEDEVVSD